MQLIGVIEIVGSERYKGKREKERERETGVSIDSYCTKLSSQSDHILNKPQSSHY